MGRHWTALSLYRHTVVAGLGEWLKRCISGIFNMIIADATFGCDSQIILWGCYMPCRELPGISLHKGRANISISRNPDTSQPDLFR